MVIIIKDVLPHLSPGNHRWFGVACGCLHVHTCLGSRVTLHPWLAYEHACVSTDTSVHVCVCMCVMGLAPHFCVCLDAPACACCHACLVQ